MIMIMFIAESLFLFNSWAHQLAYPQTLCSFCQAASSLTASPNNSHLIQTVLLPRNILKGQSHQIQDFVFRVQKIKSGLCVQGLLYFYIFFIFQFLVYFKFFLDNFYENVHYIFLKTAGVLKLASYWFKEFRITRQIVVRVLKRLRSVNRL